ncbi:MAG: cation transporter [Eggerthellaceae bacterium]|nr:cation transporter [Eggerthellaceae bacterium]
MTSFDREHIIVRTSIVGIVANILLVAFKAAVGLAANSIAIVLDAVNNLTDALSSVITIIGAKLAGKRPDRKHPLGHGRYEYLSAMVIVAIVLYAGITSLVESIKKIIYPEVADYSIVTLVIVAAAVIVKIILGRYVSAKGKQVDSGSLIASGKDALFDAAISASVLAAALIYLGTGIALEAYVGVIISIVIIKAGIDMLRETLDDILGSRPDADLAQGIKRTVCSDPDVLGAYDLLLESYGPDLTIGAIHVEVIDTMTASEIDAMTRRIQADVLKEHHIALATVGIYSRNTGDDEVAEMRSSITRVAMGHEGVLQMHGFYVDLEQKRISFDLIIDFETPDRVNLYKHISDDVQELYPDYDFVITLDRDLSD